MRQHGPHGSVAVTGLDRIENFLVLGARRISEQSLRSSTNWAEVAFNAAMRANDPEFASRSKLLVESCCVNAALPTAAYTKRKNLDCISALGSRAGRE
jgi:hypothetical protein